MDIILRNEPRDYILSENVDLIKDENAATRL